MERMIGIVDLRDGRVVEARAGDTPTLDVPADFRHPDGVVSLDDASQGHYVASDGKRRDYPAHVLPLSRRASGEEFLIAGVSRRSASRNLNLYRLAAIDPV